MAHRAPDSPAWALFRVVPPSYIVAEVADDDDLAIVLLVQCDCSGALEDTNTEKFAGESFVCHYCESR
jgi:hypothetical protein